MVERALSALDAWLASAGARRTQEANRKEALNRLTDLIKRASIPPRIRKKTRPTRESKEKRLALKKLRAEAKRLRGPVEPRE